MSDQVNEKFLDAALDGKSIAGVIAAVAWGVVTMLQSPDAGLAFLIVGTLGAGVVFALWVRWYNRQQDGRIGEIREERDECRAQLRHLDQELQKRDVALALLAASERRSSTSMVLRILLGDERYQKVSEDVERIRETSLKKPRRS